MELAKVYAAHGIPVRTYQPAPHSFGTSRSHIIAEGILDAPPGWMPCGPT